MGVGGVPRARVEHGDGGRAVAGGSSRNLPRCNAPAKGNGTLRGGDAGGPRWVLVPVAFRTLVVGGLIRGGASSGAFRTPGSVGAKGGAVRRPSARGSRCPRASGARAGADTPEPVKVSWAGRSLCVCSRWHAGGLPAAGRPLLSPAPLNVLTLIPPLHIRVCVGARLRGEYTPAHTYDSVQGGAG